MINIYLKIKFENFEKKKDILLYYYIILFAYDKR